MRQPATAKPPGRPVDAQNTGQMRGVFLLFRTTPLLFDPAMVTASLDRIVEYCDRLLRTNEVQDYDRAANGLQVANGGTVTRLAATVDGTLATVRSAIDLKADLLLVHHGIFWGASHPWTGKRYELMRLLVENNLGVYSSHLPLDAHPRFGNNAILSVAMGFKIREPFFFDHGGFIGFKTKTRLPREELGARLQNVTGTKPFLIPAGPKVCRKIGLVSGGAGGDLQKAADEGVDTFITGEGPHWTYGLAEELGINVFYAGHYATETFGVKALAAHLSRKFRLPWSFIDHPTGL
jgi:dinuclear metal center YbgI/SA1388 family protein